MRTATTQLCLFLGLASPHLVASWCSQHHGIRRASLTRTLRPPAAAFEADSVSVRRHGGFILRLVSSRQRERSPSSSPLTKLAASTDFAEETETSVDTTTNEDGDALEAQNFMVDQDSEYQRGLAVIMFVTFIFAAHSPLAHAAFSLTSKPPPVLLVNAGAAVAALCGIFLFKPILESSSMLDTPELQNEEALQARDDSNDIRAGFEMAVFKTIGKVCISHLFEYIWASLNLNIGLTWLSLLLYRCHTELLRS